MKPARNKLSFFKRIRAKYRVSVLNEGTLEEVHHLRVSALGLVVALLLGFLLVSVGFYLLLTETPLRQLLPENVDASLRREVVMQSLRVDSLVQEVQLRQEYINTLRGVVMGDIAVDSTVTSDSIISRKRAEVFMEKSELEKEFVELFEADEQYDLDTSDPALAGIVFFKPVVGIITEGFGSEHPGVDITTDDNAPVSAVFGGVVLMDGYRPGEGHYLLLVHKQGFLSVYRGCSRLFKHTGDVVHTGEVIGMAGVSETSGGHSLHFELWNGMQPQNPEHYILFQ